MPRRRYAFTLIEILVVLTVVGLIASVSAPFLVTAVQAIDLLTSQSGLQDNAEVALSRISREARRLRNDQSVQTASGTTFRFTDLDNNDITYTQSGTTLTRQVQPNAADVLADSVSAGGWAITYYDDDGNSLASPTVGIGTSTDIRRIQFQITFQDDNQTLKVDTAVRPRNLRHESDFFA